MAARTHLHIDFDSLCYDELANGAQQFLDAELPLMDMSDLKNASYERPR